MGGAEWIALADVVITAFLTAIIILQTKKLNKRQQEFEETVHQRESELQKRQIQIETFPYKREIYKNTFAVLECCNALKELSRKVDLTSKTGKQLSEMIDVLCKQYVPDIKTTLWSLREAEYILPSNLSRAVIDIRSCFDDICTCLNYLGTIESLLTEAEIQTMFPEIKVKNINSALNSCNKALLHLSFIEKTMPQELSISELNR